MNLRCVVLGMLVGACVCLPSPVIAAEPAGNTTVAKAPALSEDEFWKIIEQTRPARLTEESSEVFAEKLGRKLSALPAEKIEAFQLHLTERFAESYRWDLWGVAYIVNGGASDDGFTYFQAWLIAQGKTYFRAALTDPERAAERASRDEPCECEFLLSIAPMAYERVAKRPFPPPPKGSGPREPAGKKWKEEDLPKLYPKLWRRFASEGRE